MSNPVQVSNSAKAYLLAGLTVLCWSTVSTAFKLALRGLTPIQLILISMVTAWLFLSLLILPSRKQRQSLGQLGPAWAQAGLTGLLLFIYYLLLFEGYARLPAQLAQPINYTWSLILALLAAVLLGQKLGRARFGLMLLAYAGVLVIVLGQPAQLGRPDPIGLVCVLASTVIYAVYWILNTKSPVSPLPGLWACFGLASLAACLYLLAQGGFGALAALPATPAARLSLYAAVYVGLLELGLPFLLWGRALRLTDNIPRLSTLPFLVPFLALFWIHLILGEPIRWTTPLGLLLIVLGTVLLQRSSK